MTQDNEFGSIFTLQYSDKNVDRTWTKQRVRVDNFGNHISNNSWNDAYTKFYLYINIYFILEF